MTRKRRRLLAVLAGLTMLGVATALVLLAFNDNLVFFYSPSDLKAKHVAEGRRIRIGGLVATASVTRDRPSIAFPTTRCERAGPLSSSRRGPHLLPHGQSRDVARRVGR